jgi:MFS family permease
VLAWIVPSYAREIGIAPSLIGLLILANAATVVLAQLPIVRVAEGRSRVGALSLAAAVWVLACLLALQGSVACLLAAAVAFAIGECLHATSFMPLIADLAPPALRGRYMATAGLSWWLGLAVSPVLPLLGGAAVAASAIVVLRASEPALPLSVRGIPRPRPRGAG